MVNVLKLQHRLGPRSEFLPWLVSSRLSRGQCQLVLIYIIFYSYETVALTRQAGITR